MSSLFTKVINREIPAYIVGEDDDNIAFLDIQPLVKGHTLVVPKKEVDYFLDLEDDLYVKFHLFAKKIAVAVQKAMKPVRVGTSIVGLEVPHLHLHLVPLQKISDINFSNERLRLSGEEFGEIAKNISRLLH